MFRALLVPLVVASPLALSSCGSVGYVKRSSAAATAKVARFSFSDLIPAQVKVVEVRKKDLKDLPLGHERVLAYQKERGFGFWPIGGPVEFVQPELPEPGAEMDGSLLPPKSP
jgi:hypothetical protein